MNVTWAEARNIALSCLKSWEDGAASDLVLLDGQTIERGFGWVYRLAGNAPVVVTKADGRVHQTGIAHPIEHYLKEFEHYHPNG